MTSRFSRSGYGGERGQKGLKGVTVSSLGQYVHLQLTCWSPSGLNAQKKQRRASVSEFKMSPDMKVS